ncbi:ATP-dependent RNA helicase DDX41 [Forsythia ovata]|uniref:ATP-dependent RNA helicase DDX41 n=1 Tax=Forsythia ovata TaxID=205694 RepID=A0ABD1X1V4_9LAMI
MAAETQSHMQKMAIFQMSSAFALPRYGPDFPMPDPTQRQWSSQPTCSSCSKNNETGLALKRQNKKIHDETSQKDQLERVILLIAQLASVHWASGIAHLPRNGEGDDDHVEYVPVAKRWAVEAQKILQRKGNATTVDDDIEKQKHLEAKPSLLVKVSQLKKSSQK